WAATVAAAVTAAVMNVRMILYMPIPLDQCRRRPFDRRRPDSFTCRLRAAGRELRLERQKIKEIKLAVAVEVDEQIADGKHVLELEEVEDVEHTVVVEIGSAAEAAVERQRAQTEPGRRVDPTIGECRTDHRVVRRSVAEITVVIIHSEHFDERVDVCRLTETGAG